ncbi:hypothetical protein [Nostoc sp. WHI]|uniref:hypothetical protein n=1 Tax=Nostoc sp. WHI TaxID=2650611 RepID=UPI0018C66787|nr:hypothetical protein [Nostoc sp. WHI]MBG1270360.1 hypothetical protein [Nostoc sp. WHI]
MKKNIISVIDIVAFAGNNKTARQLLQVGGAAQRTGLSTRGFIPNFSAWEWLIGGCCLQLDSESETQ